MRQTLPRRLRWLRDPLFAFLAIGAGIFAVDVALERDDSRTIVLTEAQLTQMAQLWEAQAGRPPTDAEQRSLVADHVREEILVREARRLGLDQEDVIVRRRLAQKLTFLTEDIAALAPPEEAALRDYFLANRHRYATPGVVSFSHIYFGPDQRQAPSADAAAALAALAPDAWRTTGDPFLLGRTYAHASTVRVRRDFGDAFADAVLAMPADAAWRGPVASAYGAHLVRVDAKTPAAAPGYEAVAKRVAADYDAERRAEANRAYFEDLRAQYTVVVAGDAGGPEPDRPATVAQPGGSSPN